MFNLSNLQGYITSKYKGWTADKVLKVAQSLYEKKYITYPRTASIALEESLIAKTQKVVNLLAADLPFKNEVKFVPSKRIFDNKKWKATVRLFLLMSSQKIKPRGRTSICSDKKSVINAIYACC